MNTSPEPFSGELSEPALDLIDPRRRRRREVDMIMRPPGEPRLDLGGFVGGIVIHDDMDIKPFGDVGIDLFEEVQELSRPVTLVAFADDETRGDVVHAPNLCRGRVLRIPSSHLLLLKLLILFSESSIRTLANMDGICERNTKKVCWYRSWYRALEVR
jgi:hypothetical protein